MVSNDHISMFHELQNWVQNPNVASIVFMNMCTKGQVDYDHNLMVKYLIHVLNQNFNMI